MRTGARVGRVIASWIGLPTWALVAGCASSDAGAAACPASGACPSGCEAVSMREIDAQHQCLRVVADPGCATEALRPAVTTCCAMADGRVFAIVGFPSCGLNGYQPCDGAP